MTNWGPSLIPTIAWPRPLLSLALVTCSTVGGSPSSKPPKPEPLSPTVGQDCKFGADGSLFGVLWGKSSSVNRFLEGQAGSRLAQEVQPWIPQLEANNSALLGTGLVLGLEARKGQAGGGR